MGPGFEPLRAYYERERDFANLPFVLGEMAEWSIASVLKTDVLRGTGGSNPSLSAEDLRNLLKVSKFLFVYVAICIVVV